MISLTRRLITLELREQYLTFNSHITPQADLFLKTECWIYCTDHPSREKAGHRTRKELLGVRASLRIQRKCVQPGVQE